MSIRHCLVGEDTFEAVHVVLGVALVEHELMKRRLCQLPNVVRQLKLTHLRAEHFGTFQLHLTHLKLKEVLYKPN